MKIGLLKEEYPEKRCITYQKDTGDNKYVLTPEKQKQPSKLGKFSLRVLNHIKWRLGMKSGTNWDKTAVIRKKNITGIERVDCLHTFNVIPDIGDTPWCCTFESEVPVTTDLLGRPWEKNPDWHSRFSKNSLRLLKLCARRNCLGLIAISTSAYVIQKELILRSDLKEEEKQAILQKLVCIHPPQRLLITEEEYQNKFSSPETVNFILVGHDFFRKGGMQVLLALNGLYEQGMRNFRFIIVSKLVYIADHTGSATKENYDAAMAIIENSDWIDYYPELSNEKVLEMMKKVISGFCRHWMKPMDTVCWKCRRPAVPALPPISARWARSTATNADGFVISDPTGSERHFTVLILRSISKKSGKICKRN